MTLSLSVSALQASSSWTHTFPANGCAIAVACFKGPTSVLMATTHQVTGVTYGNVALTLRCDPLQVASHVCVWETDDYAALLARDDDVVRVTGGSFGGGSNQYSGRSYIVRNTDGTVSLADSDEAQAGVGPGGTISKTVTGTGLALAVISCTDTGILNFDELAGQIRISSDQHTSGQRWLSSYQAVTTSDAIGYENTSTSGGLITAALGVLLYEEVPYAIATMDRAEVAWQTRAGFDAVYGGDQLVYMQRGEVEWQTRAGFEPVASTGQRQVPIIGGTIETAEMTTGGTEGQVLTQHTDRPPSWEDPSGETPATTVEPETTFGLSPAVGTDTEYARQDHTHGTPANPATGAVGPLLISDDHSTPIVFGDLLLTEEEDDLLYADVG